jgi:hypothetical protein
VGRIKMQAVALAIAALGGSAASAETLTVSGWYAAEERSASMLQSLAVDRFDGDDGPELTTAIERELGFNRDREGNPYFAVRSRYAKDVEGIVHGSMRVRVDRANFKRKAKRCAANPSSSKCKDAEKIEVDLFCERRIVSATVNVRITRMADDATVYNRNLPQRNEAETCEGEKPPKDVDLVVNDLVRSIANQFANQITPYGRTEKIRVRESRSGLSKEDGNQMKSLIAATKTSESAACAGWRDMEQRGVSHPTLKFNLGLCAEAAGQLDVALGYYRPLKVAAQNTADVNEAINRVERRLAGEEDDRLRSKKPVKP